VCVREASRQETSWKTCGDNYKRKIAQSYCSRSRGLSYKTVMKMINKLTPKNRVLTEKLTVAQLTIKLPACNGSSTVRHLLLIWATLKAFNTTLPPTSWSRGSSVSTVTKLRAERLRNRGSIPDSIGCGAQKPPNPCVPLTLSPEAKR
jgi:hypothetical protein